MRVVLEEKKKIWEQILEAKEEAKARGETIAWIELTPDEHEMLVHELNRSQVTFWKDANGVATVADIPIRVASPIRIVAAF